MVQDALAPARSREFALLVNSKQWPLLAARMAQVEDAGKSIYQHLLRLTADLSWVAGPSGQLTGRLVQATVDALRKPPPGFAFAAPNVSTAAAKAPSPAGPTRPPATAGSAPAEPAVAPHRDPAPANVPGRKR